MDKQVTVPLLISDVVPAYNLLIDLCEIEISNITEDFVKFCAFSPSIKLANGDQEDDDEEKIYDEDEADIYVAGDLAAVLKWISPTALLGVCARLAKPLFLKHYNRAGPHGSDSS
jgi:hypothetical protein